LPNPMYLGHIISDRPHINFAVRFRSYPHRRGRDWFHIRVCRDEKRLLLRLGEPYERYLRSVERWLPELFKNLSQVVFLRCPVCFLPVSKYSLFTAMAASLSSSSVHTPKL